MNSIPISIVVPVYNSSKFLHVLLESLENEKKMNHWDLELILVDDGSIDNSFEVIRSLSNEYKYIRAIKLSRNFGHQIAVKTGLSYACKDFVAVIDDDLQDTPDLIQKFIEILNNGFDVVYGVGMCQNTGVKVKL